MPSALQNEAGKPQIAVHVWLGDIFQFKFLGKLVVNEKYPFGTARLVIHPNAKEKVTLENRQVTCASNVTFQSVLLHVFRCTTQLQITNVHFWLLMFLQIVKVTAALKLKISLCWNVMCFLSTFHHTCDVACQNQAFVAEMSCSVIMFLVKNVTLAFIWYIIYMYVSMPYQAKVMLLGTSCST